MTLKARSIALLLSVVTPIGCGGNPDTTPHADDEVTVQPKSASSLPIEKQTQAATSNLNPSSEFQSPVLLSEPHTVLQPATVSDELASQEKAEGEYYRLPHEKRSLNAVRLKELGIEVIEQKGKAFRLVTDLPKESRLPLESLVDDLLPTLEAYFGSLPPAPDRVPLHITGFVMSKLEPFQSEDLVPEFETSNFHGKQMGAEFWMMNQKSDYYRSHLLLHEATHVYMRQFANRGDWLPAWYLEGMAEFFATHERQADGTIKFAVNPRDRFGMPGWERIAVIQRDIAGRGVRSLREVLRLDHPDFNVIESYAWSWAACKFLDSHPASQKLFRGLASRMTRELVTNLNERLLDKFDADLEANWMQYVAGLEFDFDFERAAIRFGSGELLHGQPREVDVDTSRGWQSSGIEVVAGSKYRVAATGQFTVADKPKAWACEANGVSIRYVRGQPIGRLLACVRTKGGEQSARSMLEVIPLGNDINFEPEFSGVLYLRVNDSYAELADNRGKLHVSVVEVSE